MEIHQQPNGESVHAEIGLQPGLRRPTPAGGIDRLEQAGTGPAVYLDRQPNIYSLRSRCSSMATVLRGPSETASLIGASRRGGLSRLSPPIHAGRRVVLRRTRSWAGFEPNRPGSGTVAEEQCDKLSVFSVQRGGGSTPSSLTSREALQGRSHHAVRWK